MEQSKDDPQASLIDHALAKLEDRRDQMLDLASQMMRAHDGALYELDLLFVAVMKRTSAQFAGFAAMVRARNYLCAAPMVRIQLDSALRVSAGLLVDSPHAFAVDILKGTPVRKMKSRDGKAMTDAYLVEKLSEKFPWVSQVYKKASGFIHLSEEHFFRSAAGVDDATGEIAFQISPADDSLPAEAYAEMIGAFGGAIDILLELISSWIFAKANPEKNARLRAAQGVLGA